MATFRPATSQQQSLGTQGSDNFRDPRLDPRNQAATGQLFAAGMPGAVSTGNIIAPPSTAIMQGPQLDMAAIEADIQQRAQALANQIIAEQNRQRTLAANGRIFTRFDEATDVIPNQKTFVTTGLFTTGQASMSMAYTGSTQTSASKAYYYDVYESNSASSDPQFAVAYGHKFGSGSSASGQLNDSPTRAIYSQYRLLLLNPGDTTFTFKDGVSSNSVYFVNFNRARLKDKLDPGNWQLTLAELSGSAYANNVHTGSNVRVSGSGKVITLIDDSGDTAQALTEGSSVSGRVYNIVSGSISNGIYNSSSPIYYGLVYPDLGVLVLNADSLNASASFNTVTGSNIAGDNAWKLYTSVSGAFALNRSTNGFLARNEETVTSTHYFVRVLNAEYNFSNNPTFVTGSLGEFAQPTFIRDPKVYITTVGMYNDRQELLAVAKLSKPVQKSFNNEALIKIKLDF